MSPGSSCPSCFSLGPGAVSAVEVHFCTQCSSSRRHRSPKADWKDTCLGTVCLPTLCRGRSCPRRWKAVAPPPYPIASRPVAAEPSYGDCQSLCYLPGSKELSWRDGMQPASLATLPIAFLEKGQKREAPTGLGPGALHANISCQFFFNFCPQQLQNKAWEDGPCTLKPWNQKSNKTWNVFMSWFPGLFHYVWKADLWY